MTKTWMKQLSEEKNNEEFSLLCHNYFKLAVMRVMQKIRKEYDVPKEDVHSLTISIFARFLNESCYSVGAQIKNGHKIDDIFCKEQRINLLKVLMGEELNPTQRDDLENDLQKLLNKFKEFIIKEGEDFQCQM